MTMLGLVPAVSVTNVELTTVPGLTTVSIPTTTDDRITEAQDYLTKGGFPRNFISSPIMTLMILSLSGQKHSPDTKNSFRPEYDYIVVGAGSAGSVVASRLSEEACVSVLLLEAGKTSNILTDVPALEGVFVRSDIDWNYFTEPQTRTGRGLNNNSINWNSGKTIGGGSVLNAMLYVRGNRLVYDEDWVGEAGATGWGYDDLLPYFMRLENNSNPEFLYNGFHAQGGPISVEQPRYNATVKEPLKEAARELGYKFVDSNAATQTGFYDLQATMRMGQRCSTAKGYLVPAEDRPNLDILEKAMVTKLLFDDQKRATGVRFNWNGKTRQVKARREVILSAGAIGTPQLLMLSGIGPEDLLDQFKIPLIAALPVGDNLQDHVAAPVFLSLDITKVEPDLVTYLNPVNQLQYINNRTGRFAGTTAGPLLTFLKADSAESEVDDPDFQLYFLTGPDFLVKKYFNFKEEFYQRVFGPYKGKPFLMCLSQPLRPESRGTVRIKSTNPYDHPVMQPNYYEAPKDMQDAKDGLRICRRLCETSSMKALGCKEFQTVYPGCENFVGDEDGYLTCMVETIAATIWHKSCTAKMGDPDDPSTVVDPQLRVKGVTGLRVVDASIMPTLTAGNPNIPVIAIAEKASDMIRQDIACNQQYQGQYGVRQPAS